MQPECQTRITGVFRDEAGSTPAPVKNVTLASREAMRRRVGPTQYRL
jgi:hypothetical protein